MLCLSVLVAAVLMSSSAFASENSLAPSFTVPQKLIPYGAVGRDGYFKGIRLAGKVQVVNSFPDLKVKRVDNFPDKIGEWKFVDNFPDFTIQYVKSFPDIKIQFVNSFPGVP